MKNPIQSMAKLATMLFIATISVVSCKKKTETPAPVANEDITEVLVTLKRIGGGSAGAADSVVYKAFFSKGYTQAATTPPVYSITSTKRTLTLGVVYSGKVRFLNGVNDVTGSINNPNPPVADAAEEGAKNHQVYYNVNSALTFLSYEDQDPNGKPIGIVFSMSTSSTAVTSGSLNLKLIHKPNKAANSATTPHIYSVATIGGSTDVDVTFGNIVVQ